MTMGPFKMRHRSPNFLIWIFAVFIIAFFAVVFVKVRFFEDGSYWSSNTVQVRSDKVSRIEATGEDLRTYEFTPQSAPHMQCVFTSGTNKGSLVCFPKAVVAK